MAATKKALAVIAGMLILAALSRASEIRVEKAAKRAANATMSEFYKKDLTPYRKMAEKCKKKINEMGHAVVASYQRRKTPPERKTLYLGISQSMPLSLARAYITQAERLNCRLVLTLKGFPGGMQTIRPTIAYYFSLALKDAEGGYDKDNIRALDLRVDPVRMEQVGSVPALMDEQGCVVYGDAPLRYLAEQLEQGKCGERFGATYAVAEQDPREEIRRAAAAVQESLQARFEASLESFTGELPGKDALPPASANETITIVPEYALPFDVYDPATGDILYPKGFSYNPLIHIPLGCRFRWWLINGERPSEIQWLRRQPREMADAVLVLGGNYTKLTRVFNGPVFSGMAVAQKGWCKGTPCRITREGKALTVTTWKVKK